MTINRRVAVAALCASLILSGRLRAAVCSPTTFIASQIDSSAAGITAIASGYIDGDGNLDIAVLAPDSVHILLGNGDGTFTSQPGPIFSYYTGALLLVDVNQDHKLDLVSLIGSELAVSLGNGDGTFQTPITSNVSINFSSSYSLIAGDFDEDGHLDLAIAWSYPTGGNVPIALAKGDGNGNFTALGTLSAGLGGHRLRTGYVNGDSHLDLVATNYQDGSISVLLGNGNGTFAARHDFVAGSGPLDLELADFDDDGKIDVTVTATGFVSVLRGLGNGSFLAAVQYPAAPNVGPLTVADLNGDGLPDVATAGPSNFCCANYPGSVSALLDSAGGALQSPLNVLGPSNPTGIVAGDFNGDGIPDLAIGGSEGVFTILGTGQFFLAPTTTTVAGFPFDIADVDEDGRPDLVGVFNNTVVLQRSLGEGAFQKIVLASFTDSPSRVVLGDFDGDGHADILVERLQFQKMSFMKGHGDGTFDDPVDALIGVYAFSTLAGDFDWDGQLDLAFLSSDSQVHVYKGNGDGTFSSWTSFPVSNNTNALYATDLNGDGHPDVVAVTPGFNANEAISAVSSPTGFGPTSLTTLGGSAIALGDVTADGKADLLVAAGANVEIHPGDGDGSFSAPFYLGLSAQPTALATGDFDADGRVDFVAITIDNKLSFVRSLGGTSFASPEYVRVGAGVSQLVAVDLTGGGVPDVLAIQGTGQSSLAILLASSKLAASAPPTTTACLGSPVTLKTAASGYGPVTYQWRKGGQPVSDGGGVTGSQTSTLHIASASLTDQGSYDVVVTDLCTTATSDAATLTVGVPLAAPTIAPASVSAGAAAITISIASPAPAGGALVHLTGPSVPATVTIPAGSTSTTFTAIASGPGTSFVLTADVTVGGCTSPLATKTISVDFNDVPAGNPFREFVNTLSRDGVTAGCGNGNFCPDAPVTRAQMAVFLLVSDEGPGYVPPPCSTPSFSDVPCSSGFAPWIDELAARNVTSGCAPGLFCPTGSVTREQMAVFVLRTHDGPSYVPPPCTGTPIFNDVPCSSPFAPWIQELYNRGVVTGCGSGNFCPTVTVSRAQMAVFLVGTFALH